MDCPHVDWQPRTFKADRHQHTAISGIARLAFHPSGVHRERSPDDDDCPGAFQFGADQRVKFVTRRDFRIPPHRPPLRLKSRDQRGDTSLVRAGIGNKDICHCRRHAHSVSRYGITGSPEADLRPCGAAALLIYCARFILRRNALYRESSCSEASSGSTFRTEIPPSRLAKALSSHSNARSFSARHA